MTVSQTPCPSRQLTVTSRVEGKVAYYDVYAGSARTTAHLKTTRFSELDELHAAVLREAAGFRGCLPPKTLKRSTNAAFVESRRADIEIYLRIMATDKVVCECEAFKNFFELNYPPSIDDKLAAEGSTNDSVSTPSNPSQRDEDDDSEAEITILNSTLNDELMEKLINHKNSAREAGALKEQIEGDIAAGEKSMQWTKTEAEATAALEAEAAARLRTHKVSLEEQEALLIARKASKSDEEAEQLAAAERLSEELAAATSATKEAQGRYEQARRGVIEAAAVARSNLDAAKDAAVSAGAAAAAAAEHHQAVQATMDSLKERLSILKKEALAAEREKEARADAAKVLKDEILDQEKNCRVAEKLARRNVDALASHQGDAARRARAHDAEVRRAKEKSEATATLRDMRSRGEIMGEDRQHLAEAEQKAKSAAEAMANAFAAAIDRQKKAKENDEQKIKALQTEADKAAAALKDRQRVLAATKTRASASEEELFNASSVHAAAMAKVQAIQKEYNSLKESVEGPLKAACNESQAKFEAAKANVVLVRTKSEKIQSPLRHAEEAEAVVLRKHEATEASLVQALDAARTAAAEAHEDAGGDDKHADVDAGLEIDLLAASCNERLKDHEQLAQEAGAAHKQALEELESARKQLQQFKAADALRQTVFNHNRSSRDATGKSQSFDSDDSDEEEKKSQSHGSDAFHSTLAEEQPEARLEARIADLEQVVREKEADRQIHVEAAKAAQAEFEALEQQRRALPSVSLEKLISMELKLATNFYSSRKDRETAVLAEANDRALVWAEERESLRANLHRTDLQIKVAEEEVAATKKLQETLQ